MQPSPVPRRLLSSLASRFHPQLPLSPRESQQLLNLLTTSFRAHLDREHPLPDTAAPQKQPTAAHHHVSPTQVNSSHASTSRHLDSILTNPLFAVKPRPRDSQSAAVGLLQDPMAWFVNEIATGTATLTKAAMCLQILQSSTQDPRQTRYTGRLAATVLAEWLQTSRLDTSRQFVDRSMKVHVPLLARLVSFFVAEGETATVWRWYIRPTEKRLLETGLSSEIVGTFRRRILSIMMSVQADKSLNEGIATFLQACRIAETVDSDASRNILKYVNGQLVTRITSKTTDNLDPELYRRFMMATPQFGSWQSAVDAMLWLHHPTEPSAEAGLRFLEDPATAARSDALSPSRRQFLVQLCLNMARLCLQKESYVHAQFAMEFAKQHFPDIVHPDTQAPQRRAMYSEPREQRHQRNLDSSNKLEKREQMSLDLLNGLALT